MSLIKAIIDLLVSLFSSVGTESVSPYQRRRPGAGPASPRSVRVGSYTRKR